MMEPVITTAIVAALANLSQDAIKDSYGALKTALQRKFGQKKDLVDAVNKLEEQPDSKARKAVLEEEINKAKVNDDSEILQLAQELLKQLDARTGASKYSIDVAGDIKGNVGDISGGTINQTIK